MSAIDFDDEKSERCLRERGFDFDYAARIFDGETVEFQDDCEDYGEIRVKRLRSHRRPRLRRRLQDAR